MEGEDDKRSSASRYFKNESSSVFDQLAKNDNTSEPTLEPVQEIIKKESQGTDPNRYETHDSPYTSANLQSIPVELALSNAYNLADDILRTESIINPSHGFSHASANNDRAYDAWIPSKSTKEALESLASSPTGTFKVDKELLVTPGIAIKEEFDDPIKSIQSFLGQEEANEPRTLTSSSVTQDDNGLRQLIASGCYYAAVNLTTHLLAVYGQGERKPGQICKHTAHSIQLWFTRIALLVKLRRFSMAEVECDVFGDLNSPDLYFDFYPEFYGGRKGSMVPFSFRLLVAELPQYLGKHLEALDLLSKLLSTCDKILENVSKGLAEDGTETVKKNKEGSIRIWTSRRVRVLYSLTRCAVSLKDFRLASTLLESLLKEEGGESSGLFAALGRLCLYLGDVNSAQEAFNRHLECSPSGADYDPVQGLIHSSFVACAQNDFVNATEILKQAIKISPKNALVINNLGVCLIFIGKIREAIDLVQTALFSHPNELLHEALVLNLSTMYELESSKAQSKKMKLLTLIGNHKGDGFNTAALKLQV